MVMENQRIEVGSLYRLRTNPKKVFVLLDYKIEPKISVGFTEPAYSIKMLETNGEISSYIVVETMLERIA
jgi:hypothetical protein